jgi:hypothetical protein
VARRSPTPLRSRMVLPLSRPPSTTLEASLFSSTMQGYSGGSIRNNNTSLSINACLSEIKGMSSQTVVFISSHLVIRFKNMTDQVRICGNLNEESNSHKSSGMGCHTIGSLKRRFCLYEGCLANLPQAKVRKNHQYGKCRGFIW